MARIYKAMEKDLDRVVAIKVLHSSLTSDKAFRERFKREGKVLSAMAHPHILQFYRFGVSHDGMAYIAMEYLQ